MSVRKTVLQGMAATYAALRYGPYGAQPYSSGRVAHTGISSREHRAVAIGPSEGFCDNTGD